MVGRRLGNSPIFLALKDVSIPQAGLLLSVLAVLGAAARNRVQRGTWRLRTSGVDGIVLLCCGACTLFALYFQWYTANYCPVSLHRREATVELAVVLMQFLKTEMAMHWWVDFGSLLAVLRHSPIMVWDPDVDFSLVAPPAPAGWAASATAMAGGAGKGIPPAGYTPPAGDLDAGRHAGARALAQGLREYLARELRDGEHTVDYTEERGLIQVHRGVAHGDLWLWGEDGAGNLVSHDFTTAAGTRSPELVLPPKCDERWLGLDGVCVPRAPGELMRAEFGGDYMTPLVSDFECFENIWNGRLERGTYLAMLLVLAPFMAACARLCRCRCRCGRRGCGGGGVALQLYQRASAA